MTVGAQDFDKADIGVDLVTRLIATQFPEWAELPVSPVAYQGWDNRTFRLGAEMAVRLPSAEGYAAQVNKEHRWLPHLAPHLPIAIPEPIALGHPANGYPWHWSVNRWIDGEIATVARISDPVRFALCLADFLAALQRIDPTGGPSAGKHSFFRGASLLAYDAETRRAISTLSDEIDAGAATSVWERALGAAWLGPPVWFHGDVASGNLLIRDGELAAVIDFGTSGVGDPACDVTIAWTFLMGDSRQAFRAALPLDDATWARGRGWALWKALITLVGQRDGDPAGANMSRRIISDVVAEHMSSD